MGIDARRVVRDGVVLAVLGAGVGLGTFHVLAWLEGGVGARAPVEFDERVLAEASPFVADVRAARQVVEERYAYLEHRRATGELDLDALEAAALAELGEQPTEPAFRRALRRFVAGLRDGHAAADFAEYRLPGDRHWPFTPLLVAEGVMVDGVHPDAADRLARGDLVLAVDGTPVEELLAEAARFTCASSDGARRRLALEDLARWTRAAELELRLSDLSGAERTVRVECPLVRLRIATPGALPTEREARVLAGGVAYFRPGSFAPPAESGFADASPAERHAVLAGARAEIARTVEGFAGARALVLDLRGNPGGTDLLGMAVAAHLLEPGFTYYRLSALRGRGWSRPSAHRADVPERVRPLRVPLGCLVDEGTFSVADNLAACLRDLHPEVTFVGRATGAGSGAPRWFDLPRTGARIRFCTQRVYSPAGRLIEGTGVQPDVRSLRSRADVLAGRDAALATALELLAE